MKAIFQTGYGSPDAFELREVAPPRVKDDQVLVRVGAAALHAGDVWFMRGIPYMVRFSAGLPRPKNYIPGYDMAGVVEEIGKDVAGLKPGDEVFGAHKSTCAEYVSVPANRVVPKPHNLTLEQAAAVPTSALAALHGLRDAGKVQPGQKVLINGASGGVGTYAVQIAKVLGAEVTGVCGTSKTELIKSLGADHMIDYTRDDFTRGNQRYDLILDQVANHSMSDCRRALTTRGVYIPNSGNGGLGLVIKAFFSSLFLRQQGRPYLSTPNKADLLVLKELIESGKLRPVIGNTYPMENISQAFRYLNEGHARGKVMITIGHDA
jgi:NADPH:quinone reductase-like Zn-dependent oxidoreductase